MIPLAPLHLNRVSYTVTHNTNYRTGASNRLQKQPSRRLACFKRKNKRGGGGRGRMRRQTVKHDVIETLPEGNKQQPKT